MKLSGKSGSTVNKGMIGLFFEDINFAADGGLYAEMIENRSFEAKEAHGTPGNYYTLDDPGFAWSPVGGADLKFVTGRSLSENNPHYMRICAATAGDGAENKAYDGITMKQGMKYKISFYARCVSFEGDCFTVSINKDGKCFGSVEIKAIKAAPYTAFMDTVMMAPLKEKIKAMEESGVQPEDGQAAAYIAKYVEALKLMDDPSRVRACDWVRYEGVLKASENIRGAEFVLTLDAPGVVEFDLISMIPEDAVAGIFRRDLFEALQAIHPGFIRFPGGCIVEGVSLENRYRWKNTVGPLKDRKIIPCLWAFMGDAAENSTLDDMREASQAHYLQSYGIGFYEYFLLCELLGAKPLPVFNMGAACQFRSTEMVASDSEEFIEYVQDALDLIEFANGPADTKWGGLRAAMGHEAPFDLEMVAIGNEQWETSYFDGLHRYELFEAEIHKTYPNIKLLGTAGPIVQGPLAQIAWDFYRKNESKKPGFCYAVDEHYYVKPEWLYGNIDFYNDYPEDVAVFAGEYAAHDENKENSMEAALAEAAFLTGVEKNAKAVKLASYAPLFNRMGYSQWNPDMIWFDDSSVYLTPSYYVQMLFATNMGSETVPMEGQEVALRENKVYVSVVRDGGEYIIKAVNAGEKDYFFELSDENGAALKEREAQVICMEGRGRRAEVKTPEGLVMPEEVSLKEDKNVLNGGIMLPGRSVSVIRFHA